MKALIGFIVVVVILAGMYYAYVFVVGKAFQATPAKEDTEDSRPVWQTQSEKTAELMQRQRDIQRQQQERLREMQHR